MNRKTSTLLTLIAATTIGGAALADQGFVTGHHEMPDNGNNMHFEGEMLGHFEHLDQDNDGKVTRAEMAAHEDRMKKFKNMVENRMGPNR
ncbi:MAG: hypothetical protein AAFW87_01595 [Pseudomonadota bacterium]